MIDPVDSEGSAQQSLSREQVLACYTARRVLVLGAGGFIGRWVARLLTEAGADLWLTARDFSAQSIFDAYGIRGRLTAIDLGDGPVLARLLRAAQPAIVFNLAGYGVDRAERDRDQAYRINAVLVKNLCRGLAGASIPPWPGRRLVHAGSALEYGRIAGNLDEDTTPAPDTLYGCSKLTGTQALMVVAGSAGLQALVARLFTVYGPGEHEGRLLPTLLSAARTGRPAELTNGLQQRDFTYVEDVAEGLLRLGVSCGTPGEVVNLATGHLTTVREYAETAARVLALPRESLRFGTLPARPEEMQHDPVTLDRLLACTGWQPGTTPAEGILKTAGFQPSACDDRKDRPALTYDIDDVRVDQEGK